MKKIVAQVSDETYIPLFRQIRKHWIWNDKPFSKGQAWIDLLLRAHHGEEPYKLVVGNEVVELNQGELFSSDLQLSEDWGWSRKKVLGYIELLRKEKMLVKKGTTKGTTYYVVNYADWKNKVQRKVHQRDNAGTTKGHKQECKEHKNVKEEYIALYKKHISNVETHSPEVIKTLNEEKQLEAIRKLVEIDKLPIADLEEMIKFVSKDSFWVDKSVSLVSWRSKSKTNDLPKWVNIKAALARSNPVKQLTKEEREAEAQRKTMERYGNK